MNSSQKEEFYNCAHCTKKNSSTKAKSSQLIFKYFECDQCHKTSYHARCVCQKSLIRKTPFFFGEKINCNDCRQSFNIVPCPLCKQMNLWNGNYFMGALVNCFQCNKNFQHLACPFCTEANFWIPNQDKKNSYRYGLKVECYKCQKSFQHLICPHCNESMFYLKCDYLPGTRQICIYCSKTFKHSNCPNCGFGSFYKDNEFIYGKSYPCNECGQKYCISVCCGCGSVNSVKGKNADKDNSNFDCSICKNKYNIVTCIKCKGPNYPVYNIKGECFDLKCLYCTENLKILCCANCDQMYICNCMTQKNKHSCIGCKKEIKMNLIDSKKINEKNKINVEQSLGASLGLKKTPSNNNDEKMLCKICFFNTIDTIFTVCGHACSCITCAKDMKKKECPVCRKQSDFIKMYLS